MALFAAMTNLSPIGGTHHDESQSMCVFTHDLVRHQMCVQPMMTTGHNLLDDLHVVLAHIAPANPRIHPSADDRHMSQIMGLARGVEKQNAHRMVMSSQCRDDREEIMGNLFESVGYRR